MSCTQLGITAWQHSLAARPVCCECAMAALQRCVRVGGAAAAHASVEPIALREDDGSRMCDRVWPVIAFARDRSASSEPRCQHDLWRRQAVDVRCAELLPCVANTRKSDEVVRMASLTLTCVSSPTRSIGVRCSERDERAVASAAVVAAPAATTADRRPQLRVPPLVRVATLSRRCRATASEPRPLQLVADPNLV